MAKRFADYTDAELVGIDNETFNDAVRIEAIQREVKPPLTLSEALRQSEWRGYQKPAEAIQVFEIIINNKYGSPANSGVGYLSKEKAESALDGMVSIEDDRYSSNPGHKINGGICCVMQRWVGVSKCESANAKFVEFTQDDTAFQQVVTECLERLSRVRQEAYDKKVRTEKRTEYLRLAGGNEEIARAFWAKTERTEFPTE